MRTARHQFRQFTDQDQRPRLRCAGLEQWQDDCVAPGPTKVFEGCVGCGVAGQGRREVGRHLGCALGLVGCLPASVCPGGLDLRESWRLHASGSHERLSLGHVDP
jgi:hypothetical protein